MLLVSYVFYYRSLARRCRLHRDGADNWLWQEADQLQRVVNVLPETVLLPWLVLLHLREETGRRRVFLVVPDSLAEEDFRILRLALRVSR